jgi:hypothetical protein
MSEIFNDATKDDQQNRDAQIGCAQASQICRRAQAGRREGQDRS